MRTIRLRECSIMKSWRVVLGFLGFWLVGVLYVTLTVMPGANEINHKVEVQLRRALDELEALKSQHKELQHLAGELKDIQEAGEGSQDEAVRQLQKRLAKVTEELHRVSKTKGIPADVVSGAPSLAREQQRRKTENTAVEFWYFLRSELGKVKQRANGNTEVIKHVDDLLSKGADYYKTVRNDFHALASVDELPEWRLKQSMELGDLVQRRLHYLQNPKDCSTAKKVVCNLHKGCGYGCQLHHVVYCLIVAYATERTLILDSQGWRYASGGWETVFLPISNTCTDRNGSPSGHWGPPAQTQHLQVIELPIVDSLSPRPEYMPLAIPDDLADRLLTFHGDPSAWWIGQIVKYLTRPQPHLKEDMERMRQQFELKSPVVGVHVRRTDKVGVEAAFHGIEEYMRYVAEYYDWLEAREKVDKRRVFLATDEPGLLAEAKRKYKDYLFLSDNDISKTAGLGSRYSDASLRGVIMDIHLLSLTDYLVCTFSSQVCRVAYEMMQTMHGDASRWFKSLDDIYYFGGQNAHNQLAAEKHVSIRKQEIEFEAGDVIGVAGNHWDGYSKGINRRTGSSGLYPSYKVVENIPRVKMPTYPEADAQARVKTR